MKNSVEMIGYYGGDETHALSGWTSTKRELTDEKRERIGGFLKFLAQSDPSHTSPFEKSALHFLVRCETASHIHLIKHRIGVSINAESARYKELRDPTFYLPDDWPDDVRERVEGTLAEQYDVYHDLVAKLEPILGRKRAKESARFVLPYANQLTMDVMFNFQSFVHFLDLRYHQDAQREIREIAGEMLRLVRETGEFDRSLAACGYGK